MPTKIIQAKNISKSFGELKVLDQVSVVIEQAEVVAITGPSGAGKTTLLQLLGTLSSPDLQGDTSLKIQENEVLNLDAKALAAFRNKSLGFVFQFHELLDEFTALENVMMPALIGGKKKADVRDKAEKLLKRLGVETIALPTNRKASQEGNNNGWLLLGRL